MSTEKVTRFLVLRMPLLGLALAWFALKMLIVALFCVQDLVAYALSWLGLMEPVEPQAVLAKASVVLFGVALLTYIVPMAQEVRRMIRERR